MLAHLIPLCKNMWAMPTLQHPYRGALYIGRLLL